MMKVTKAASWGLFVVMCVVGCSSPSKEDYIPSENAGKQALETALTAWRNGKPMERIENPDAVAVQPQDTEWQKGRKLVAFSIGDELPSTDGPKQFKARLTFQGSATPVDTVYFIVGRDPLWVFRDRDYQRTTGM